MDETEEYILCCYCDERVITYLFGEGLCPEHFVSTSNQTRRTLEGESNG